MPSCLKTIGIAGGLGVAAVFAGLVYTAITGNKACYDEYCLYDSNDVNNIIDDIKDIIPGDLNITEMKNSGIGLIEKINGIEWPDFGFEFDDVLNFDSPRPAGRGNETLFGWKRPEEGEKLKLKISNALTGDWDGYFDDAIADWNGAARAEGDADVLDLDTERVDTDEVCTPIEGIMKVCNADYGDTGWKGINECLIQGDVIISSVAKMNEFYLGLDKYQGVLTTSTLEDQRRYTMCHEIGHGFGLSHQDATFGNPDLYTCLDYTNNPGVNLQPNPEDYHALNILYGDGVQGQGEKYVNRTEGRGLRGHRRMMREFGVDFGGRKVEKRTYYTLV